LILSRLGMTDEANRVFAQAVQIDLNMGHGWAAWGRFNDQRFSQAQDINLAVNAINCYLQAATLFKAHQSRRFLARILWLLTFEDAAGSLGKSFEMYNHDLPTWFWVSFVPQLLASLARKEQRQARFVLIKIARNYPQALYLPLRTFHDDCRMQFGPRANSGNHGVNTSTANVTNPPVTPAPSVGFVQDNGIRPSSQQQQSPHMTGQSPYPGEALPGGAAASEATAAQPRKHPMEAAEDLLSILKTGYPLLALTMENAIEHICHRLRSTVDEDFYRVLTSLIGESYQHIMNRISGIVSNTPTTALMEASLRRVYTMICNSVSLAPSVGRKPSFSLIFLVQSRL
jgi:transformation/transcription domain-associated protein